MTVKLPKGECETHGPWPEFEGMCVKCASAAMPKEGITCPFCGRTDFDHLGLKHHLSNGWCEVFDQVGTLSDTDTW